MTEPTARTGASSSADNAATLNLTAPIRARFLFLGVAALIAGAIMPAWAILAAITGGLEAVAWLPVIVLYLFPVNILFFGLLVFAILCGIFAVRNGGTNRVLGWIGLILAGVQLLAAITYWLWAFSNMLLVG